GNLLPLLRVLYVLLLLRVLVLLLRGLIAHYPPPSWSKRDGPRLDWESISRKALRGLTATKAASSLPVVSFVCLIDTDRPSIEVRPVHFLCGPFCVRVFRERNKGKSARSTRLTISDDLRFYDLTELIERLPEALFVRVPTKITYE